MSDEIKKDTAADSPEMTDEDLKQAAGGVKVIDACDTGDAADTELTLKTDENDTKSRESSSVGTGLGTGKVSLHDYNF